ncbi:MAG: hypothetical protein RL766_813 [Bacteroidota bacterium]
MPIYHTFAKTDYKMRTICLDFGNTRLKAALFEDGSIKESFVLENDGVEQTREIISLFKPDRSILSSVIHHVANRKQWGQTDWLCLRQWYISFRERTTW